jgi:hypothetical protein
MRYRYNPDCSCPRCRAHALYGPAMLITVGVLFLLAQAGHSPWMEFDHTWPALLIVIGLILFLEHNASAAGHIPRGYIPAPPGTPVQGYTPVPPGASAPPQNPVVTPPPTPSAGSLSQGSSPFNPDDPEVRHG